VKKSKFLLMNLVLIVLLGFSLFFVPVEAKATSEEVDIEEYWVGIGFPLSAMDFVQQDGKGIRFYVNTINEVILEGTLYRFVMASPVQDYYFDDGNIETQFLYGIPYQLFSESLNTALNYYFDTYEFLSDIPKWDMMVISWDVDQQRFVGPNYLFYWIETSFDEGYDEGQNDGYSEGYDIGYGEGYDEGHNIGYNEGHDAGYSEGYDVGYNVGFEIAQPKMDILLITLIMYILSIIIYFKFRLKWVLIATVLLWFVPIFLVENLFIKIFSVIMIIATITITFFGEREEYIE
jgi:hypothetical protein